MKPIDKLELTDMVIVYGDETNVITMALLLNNKLNQLISSHNELIKIIDKLQEHNHE